MTLGKSLIKPGLGKSSDQNQRNLFHPILIGFIKPDHPLVILVDRIKWNEIEQEFSE